MSQDEKSRELYKLIAQIDDPALIEALFDDLCTRKEVSNMAERIYAAKLLLANTRMSVQEISDYLGYTNSNYFSTVFKRSVGMSPREYRNHSSSEKD